MTRRLELIRDRKRPDEMWDEPCPNCPSAHFPHDHESEDMEKMFFSGEIGMEYLFPCAWRPTKLCKGLCDNWKVTPEQLKQCCQIHGVHWDKWFWSKTAKAGICPKCIEAGYFVESITREYGKGDFADLVEELTQRILEKEEKSANRSGDIETRPSIRQGKKKRDL